MLKDRFLKAFGGLIALATIAFASLPTDALGVSASDYDYSSNPYNMGMFDTINSSDRTITRQTGYVYIDSASSINFFSIGQGFYRGEYNLSQTGSSNYVDFYSSGAFSSYPHDAGGYTNSIFCGFNLLGFKTNEYSSSSALDAYLSSNPLILQYKLASSTTESFDDAINGQNASDAYEDGYDAGYVDGESDSGAYTLTINNQSSVSCVVTAVHNVSDYYWNFVPSYSGTSKTVDHWFVPGEKNIFSVNRNGSEYKDFTLNVGLGSGRTYEIDCVSHGSSVDDPICLPYWEGNLTLNLLTSSTARDGYVGSNVYFAVGKDYLDGVECGMTYQRGYDDGYDAAVTTDNGIYIQWDTDVYNTDRTYAVTWYDSGNKIGSSTLSYYNSVVYFNRPYGHSYSWTITPNVAVPFTITYSASGTGGNISSVLTSDMAVDGSYYLPFWEGSITLKVTPDDSTYGSISSYEFRLTNDSSSIKFVKVGYGYAVGYAKGYEAGLSQGQEYAYDSGYNNGADDGYDVGYSDGRSDGYADGWIAGGAGDTTLEVIDVWPLLSAVITMPFTFFSTGLDWTLFSNTPYEFGVSAFFGSLLVVLMLWKIIQLIMGFGK